MGAASRLPIKIGENGDVFNASSTASHLVRNELEQAQISRVERKGPTTLREPNCFSPTI
jgi:hypothetical protein